jgi:hypothetical protein
MTITAKLIELEDRIKDLEAQEIRGGGGDVELIGHRSGVSHPKWWNISNVYKDCLLRGSLRFSRSGSSGLQMQMVFNGDELSAPNTDFTIPAIDQKYWWVNIDLRRHFGPTETRWQLDHADTLDTWEQGQNLHPFYNRDGSPANFFTSFEWYFPNPASSGASPSAAGSWHWWVSESAAGQGMFSEFGWGWRRVNTDPMTSLQIEDIDPLGSAVSVGFTGGSVLSLYGLK